MALVNCTECGKEISDLAKMCPYCGAPSLVNRLAAALLVRLFVILCFFGGVGIIIYFQLVFDIAIPGTPIADLSRLDFQTRGTLLGVGMMFVALVTGAGRPLKPKKL